MIVQVHFDADTSSSEPYYSKGDIIELPAGQGGLWLVTAVKVSGTTHRGEATLQQVDASEKNRVVAKFWNPLSHSWRPLASKGGGGSR